MKTKNYQIEAPVITEKPAVRQTLTIDGEEFTWDSGRGTIHAHIRETFHSAGKIYGWDNKYTEGVGINKKILDFACMNFATVVITIENYYGAWYLDALDWKSFCNKYNSIYSKKTRKGVIELCVVGLGFLKELDKEEKKAINHFRQLKLDNEVRR